jgi:hypothetical protein
MGPLQRDPIQGTPQVYRVQRTLSMGSQNGRNPREHSIGHPTLASSRGLVPWDLIPGPFQNPTLRTPISGENPGTPSRNPYSESPAGERHQAPTPKSPFRGTSPGTTSRGPPKGDPFRGTPSRRLHPRGHLQGTPSSGNRQ